MTSPIAAIPLNELVEEIIFRAQPTNPIEAVEDEGRFLEALHPKHASDLRRRRVDAVPPRRLLRPPEPAYRCCLSAAIRPLRRHVRSSRRRWGDRTVSFPKLLNLSFPEYFP